MQQNDNNWLDAVRDSIESIEEPLPEGMWDSVAADMAAISRRRKAVRLSLAGIAAAAAVLAGAFLILPQQGKPEAAAPLIAQAEMPATAADHVQAQESEHEQSVSPTYTDMPEMTGQPAPAATFDRLAELSEPAPAVQPETEPEPQTRAETPADKVPQKVQERKADQPADRQPEPEPQLELQPEHIPEHHSRGISTGINFALGNGSGTAATGRISTASIPAEEPVFATRAGAGLSDTFSGYHTQYAHNMPVNVGINLSIGLSDRLSLETGLTYSYHSARRYSYLNDYVMGCDRQEIHFAGLPLGLRLTAVEMRKTSVYLYAGVMTQKCLHASWNGNLLLIDPIILSSEFSAGFQYDIAGPMSVYIEPGLIHCSVSSGDEAYTMYNDAPWNFNLKGGIRFNIK